MLAHAVGLIALATIAVLHPTSRETGTVFVAANALTTLTTIKAIMTRKK
ncbi:MAG: hypothetical protein ABSF99_09350 [Anaerolineales bacterium]